MPENSQYQKVKEITEQLEQGIQELFESEKYTLWLKTMSKFHDYSLNNTLLICFQKPEATLVAGYNTWQKDFKRQVNKGEKGIRIIAPTPYKKKVEMEKIDPQTKKPVIDENGNIVKEVHEVTRPAFRVVSVFDVSQTTGKEIPSLGIDELSGEVQAYEIFFEALKRSCPVPIDFEEISGGAKGFYHQTERRIAIQKDMSQVQTIKTLIHEMAHQKLHAISDDGDAKDIAAQSRNRKEVEAESVAYTICQHYGIDTSDYSFAYIAGWSQGKETPELKDSLDTIRTSASEMIKEIDGHMVDISKEQEQGIQKSHAEEKMDIEPEHGKISFYVAECMEFESMGEFHENLTLEEAFKIYQQIPSERLCAGKGIGFDLQDGSLYDGRFPLVLASRVIEDDINHIRHFKANPLVQQAIAECKDIIVRDELPIALPPTEGTFQIGKEHYMEIHKTDDELWDYTLYAKDFREIDGGQIGDDMNFTMEEAMKDILSEYNLEKERRKVIDEEVFMDARDAADPIFPVSKTEAKQSLLENLHTKIEKVSEISAPGTRGKSQPEKENMGYEI